MRRAPAFGFVVRSCLPMRFARSVGACLRRCSDVQDVRLRPTPPLGDRVLTGPARGSRGGERDDDGGVEVEHLRGRACRRGRGRGRGRGYRVAARHGRLPAGTTARPGPRCPRARRVGAWTARPRAGHLPGRAPGSPWREILPCPSRCPRRQRRRCRRRGAFVGVTPQTSPAAVGSRNVPPATSNGQPGFDLRIVASSCSWTSPVTRAAVPSTTTPSPAGADGRIAGGLT
jgi:hypothetical protein